MCISHAVLVVSISLYARDSAKTFVVAVPLARLRRMPCACEMNATEAARKLVFVKILQIKMVHYESLRQDNGLGNKCGRYFVVPCIGLER
jgi:hypothetical protein